jgi:hypothetical protein
MAKALQPGDHVIYRKTKHSERPGPRAINVHPTPKGEEYVYEVDKFWVVVQVRDNSIVLATRRGKQHVVDRNNPALRRPNWIERWIYKDRFPSLEECLAVEAAQKQPPVKESV